MNSRCFHSPSASSPQQIGWPSTPFQNDVAYANLTIGILGLSSFWYRKQDFLLAAMVVYASCFFADGIGRLVSLLSDSNLAPGNAGTIPYTDLLTPVLVVFLLWLSRGEHRRLS